MGGSKRDSSEERGSRRRRHDSSDDETSTRRRHDSSSSEDGDRDPRRRNRNDSSDRETKSPPTRRKYTRSPSPRRQKSRERRDKSRDKSPQRQRSRDRRNKSRSKSRQRERRSRDRSQRRDKSRSRSRQRDGRSRDRSPREGRREKSRERKRSISPKPEKENKRPKTEGEKEKGDGKKEAEGEKSAPPAKKKDDVLTTRTGGAYIPPAKLRMMQQSITDKSSEAFQRLAWEALKKSINGLINKVNSPNIAVIVRELFAENIVRGRGLLVQSVIQAQTASPTFTHVYAALAAIINSKFPNIGELLIKRLIINFKRGFKRKDKLRCTSSVRFIGHLVNQQVAHEVLALEILTLLLEAPTDDSAEVAITFLKEVGQKLTEVSPRGIHAIFERLRHVLHESTLDKRTQYMIEVMFQVRKDGFKDNPSIEEGLDLLEEEDQFTHMTTLDDATSGEEILNVFKLDTAYEENEEKYKAIKKELLDEGSDSESGSGDSDSDSDSDSEEEEKTGENQTIVDNTETNLISLRRTIYLTLQSSLEYQEATHKLLKLQLKPGQEQELCHMIIDCCAQQRTYEKYFGLIGQRFCQVNKMYAEPFQNIFADTYSTVHRLETGKLRNVAKFFAHLFFTDAIGWNVMSVIKLNEDDTTSSSRIFIKILWQELAEYIGFAKLNERVRDPTLQEAFDGLFPRDNPRDSRFAINFFTSIGLGGLTEDLRNHLKTAPKTATALPNLGKKSKRKKSVSSSSSDSSSSSSDSDSSSESESEDEKQKRRRKKRESKRRSRSTSERRSRQRR